MAQDRVRRLLDAASLGEAAWVDAAGRPRATGVLPLVRHDQPVLALTFDRAELAVELAGASWVDLIVREPRNTSSDWRPSGWRCRSRLVEDVDGDIYLDDLRVQELRRYPPARRYADSPLLQREHWWYLPRLLVELEPVAELDPPLPRSDVDDLLLVTTTDGDPVSSGVRVRSGRLDPVWGPVPVPGDGVVHGQDATFPDLEVWHSWTRATRVPTSGPLAAPELPERTPLRLPRLWQRWRDDVAFAARCRRGLAAWTG